MRTSTLAHNLYTHDQIAARRALPIQILGGHFTSSPPHAFTAFTLPPSNPCRSTSDFRLSSIINKLGIKVNKWRQMKWPQQMLHGCHSNPSHCVLTNVIITLSYWFRSPLVCSTFALFVYHSLHPAMGQPKRAVCFDNTQFRWNWRLMSNDNDDYGP